jgi:hypothetical protein
MTPTMNARFRRRVSEVMVFPSPGLKGRINSRVYRSQASLIITLPLG